MSAAVINVAEVTGRAALNRPAILTATLCGLLAACDGLDNQALAFTAPAIAEAWGIKMPAFVPVFSVGLFGLMIGSLVGGWVADRFGRKSALLLAGCFFGFTTLVTPFAGSLEALMAIRFIGGLGIGGLPAAVCALIAETSPDRRRASLTMWAVTGIPGGAFIGGLAASWLIPHFGWPSVYYFAAALTLVVLALLVIGLPESTHFLALRGTAPERVARTLGQIDPAHRYSAADRFVLPRSERQETSIRALFADGRRRMTLLYWVAETVQLMIYYILSNWVPTLFRESGMTLQTSALGSAALNCGAILFTIALGPICTRFGDRRVTSACYLITVAGLGITVLGAGDVAAMMIGVFVAGAGCLGGQAAITMLITNSYPVAFRAFGAGWALTVGRIGSIISPSVVGIPLALGWHAHQILMLPIVPSLIGGACVLFARTAAPAQPATPIADPFIPLEEA